MLRSRIETVDGGFKKKGTTQGGVMAPTLFNVYNTNDQPIGEES